MAYDADLADRVRTAIPDQGQDQGPDQGQDQGQVTERRMFGGLAFLVNGHMAVAASQDGLLLRIDPAETDAVVADEGVTRAVMRGREMSGWVRVDPSAIDSDRRLTRWVRIGVTYARSLPPK